MRKILIVCLAVVFLVGCSDAFRNNDHISKSLEDQHAAMNFERSTSPTTLPAQDTADTGFISVDLSGVDTPFEEIEPTAVEFLLDYTQSSALLGTTCLDPNLPLRQGLPLFFFSLANQKNDIEMEMALGLSYFTNAQYRPVIPTNKEYRKNTLWYQKILTEPKNEGNGDDYAKIIGQAIAPALDPDSAAGDAQQKQVVILIGDGSYIQNPKDKILETLSTRSAELESEGKSLEFYALLYCTDPSNKAMWDELDQNDFIKVFYIDNSSFEWLREVAEEVFGVSEDDQFWLDDQSRDDVYYQVPGDNVVKLDAVGLNEGGQLIVNNGENIIETSRELPNWFIDRNPTVLATDDCGLRDIKIHYTGSGPIFHWLERSEGGFLDPSLTLFSHGEDNIAILKMKIPQSFNHLGIESCYEPFLKLGDKTLDVNVILSSCKFDTCLENSSLVSTYVIGADEFTADMTQLTSLEYGFRRKGDESIVARSTVLPAPFLVGQKIQMNYLEHGSPQQLKYEGQSVDTFSIQIPVLFLQEDQWSTEIKARVTEGKDNSGVFIEGLPPSAAKNLCPGTDFLVVRDDGGKIRYSLDSENTIEILMMSNVGWHDGQDNGKGYTDYCEFSVFDIEFRELNGPNIVKWICREQMDDKFVCKLGSD